jgi:hypothetical protein
LKTCEVFWVYKYLKIMVPSSLVFLVACGVGGDSPRFAIEQFSITPNPTVEPTAGAASTVKFIWRINTNATFTAGFRLAPESASDEALKIATTQAFVDCAGKCQSGTYESVCSLSIVQNQPNLRRLRCDDPAGLVVSPGRYRYSAGGGTIATGLNNKVAEASVVGIITIN